MAIQPINTTFVGGEDKSNNVEHVQVQLGAGSVTASVAAPVEGKLVGAFVQSQTTTTAVNTITLAVSNESNSAAEMVASTTYDDSTVITTNVATQLSLTSTDADLEVALNDHIEVAYTEAGTIAGGVVVLYFETAAV